MKNANRFLARSSQLRLWRAACVALTILLMTSTAFAAQPLTGTFKGKVIGQFVRFTNLNKVVTDWAGVLSLQLDRDTPGDELGPLVPVFCIEVNVLVRAGDRYKSDGPVTALPGGCQIRYLLGRYPASTATTAEEAAARQLAIWRFSDEIDLATVQEAAIKARAIALADEAALAVALGGCPGAQTSVASLTLDPPSANVVTGQTVNYTVRADPPGAAQSVDITVSGSATLQNGQQQATLPIVQGIATFSVVNPVAGSSTITARLPYALDAGTVFSPIDGSRPTQRLVLGDGVSLSASATVQATWGPATETPTAVSSTATPSTAVPSTATPSTAVPSTATPSEGTPPTTTPPTTALPTAAAPTQAPPGQAPPPATPTRKPSSGPKPSPAPENTPESTPPGGASESPAGGAGAAGPGTPTTPSASAGNDLPGGAGGAGNGASDSDVLRPSQLPNTGTTGSTVPVAITVAALLLACGIWLRKRVVRG